MNVLMLGWEFPPLISGGLGVACEGLVKAMAHQVSVQLVLPRISHQSLSKIPPENSLSKYQVSWIDGCDKIEGAPYEHAPVSTKTPPQNSLYGQDLDQWTQMYARRTRQAVQKASFDVIHAHDWMTFRAGLELKHLTGKPLVLHLHSLSYDRNGPLCLDPTFQIEKTAMESADLIITVSQYTREICIHHYGISPLKIHHVHNGIQPRLQHPDRKRNQKKQILFLGRLTRQKGPHSFLKIAHRVLEKFPNVHFTMAGDGDHREDLEKHRKALKLEGKLTFPGFLSRSQIHRLLKKTDLYCMPSISEPFGLSALEGAQYGIPCVISKQSGVAEILPHARVADYWDLDQMARHLIDLLENPSAHEEASQWAKENQQHHSWEIAAKKIIHLYRTELNIS